MYMKEFFVSHQSCLFDELFVWQIMAFFILKQIYLVKQIKDFFFILNIQKGNHLRICSLFQYMFSIELKFLGKLFIIQ